MRGDLVRTSKFLSRILRHHPESIGLELDEGGWADLDTLVSLANGAGRRLTREQILQVVARNDKQRFAVSADGRRIRANQGHSIRIDLGPEPRSPPERLFHGTAERNLESIHRQGLIRGSRQHVHLSLDEETATRVGRRHGRPIVLVVDAGAMVRDGFEFFLSENGVWLTERVPPRYLASP